MSKKNKLENKKSDTNKKKYLFSLTAIIILVLAALSLTLFNNDVSYQSCYNNIDKDTGYSNERWQEWSRYIQPDSEYTRIIHIKDMKKYEGEKQLMPLILQKLVILQSLFLYQFEQNQYVHVYLMCLALLINTNLTNVQ